ncbi:MAG TPA: 3-dehydroquinate synthase family protein [Flavobacteriales bacterium]|nr:3-dehydroquinate synthase family protein [Flavobacteriales bacterium]
MNKEPISTNPYIECGTDTLQSCSILVNKIQPDRIFLLCDSNTHRDCLPIFLQQNPDLSPQILVLEQTGEHSKTLETVSWLCESLLKNGASRKSLLIVLGGGIACDLGGFAASIFMRGMSFIHIPTTLLAMVDASSGGKTGVNFLGNKNMLGVFQQASAVLIYPPFIQTLTETELISGFAEVIKHALLSGDEQWEFIQQIHPLKYSQWDELIRENVLFKKRITDLDFQEKGVREQLNLGHTFGHAFEAFSESKNVHFPHGFAVASGILAELILSKNTGFLKHPELIEEFNQYYRRYFHPFLFGESDIPALIEFMKVDKKNTSGQITFCLLETPGIVHYQQAPAEDQILIALHQYLVYARRS